jgi:hypothetical protein
VSRLKTLWGDIRFRLGVMVAGLSTAVLWSQAGPPIIQDGGLDWYSFADYAAKGWILPVVAWGMGWTALRGISKEREAQPKDKWVVTHPAATAAMATGAAALGVEAIIESMAVPPDAMAACRTVMHTYFTSTVFPVVAYPLSMLSQFKPPHILNAYRVFREAGKTNQNHDVVLTAAASKQFTAWHGALEAAERQDLEEAIIRHDALQPKKTWFHKIHQATCYEQEQDKAEKRYAQDPTNPLPLIMLQTLNVMYDEKEEVWRLSERLRQDHTSESMIACQAEILSQAGFDNDFLLEPLHKKLARRAPDSFIEGATSKEVYTLQGSEALKRLYLAYRGKDLRGVWWKARTCSEVLGVNAMRPWGFVSGDWDTMFVRRVQGTPVTHDHLGPILSATKKLDSAKIFGFNKLDYEAEFRQQLARIKVDYKPTTAWGVLYQQNVVLHNNIHPHNVFHDPFNHRVVYIDFDDAAAGHRAIDTAQSYRTLGDAISFPSEAEAIADVFVTARLLGRNREYGEGDAVQLEANFRQASEKVHKYHPSLCYV